MIGAGLVALAVLAAPPQTPTEPAMRVATRGQRRAADRAAPREADPVHVHRLAVTSTASETTSATTAPGQSAVTAPADDGGRAGERSAAEAAREAEMFGEPDPNTDRSVADREASMFGEAPSAGEDTQQSDREASLFGERAGEPQSVDARRLGASTSDAIDRFEANLEKTDNILAIGGRLFLILNLNAPEQTSLGDFTLSSPNLLDVYLDARPNERVRAYTRGRLRYDPTVVDGQLGFTGQAAQTLRAQLDQLWLKFDVEKRLFVTLGRQPVRWGSSRFWNPSDFVNQSVRDPLAVFDQRLGVDAIKLHVPIESLGWNLYAIGAVGGAFQLDGLAGGLRAEILFGQTELALSTLIQKDQPIRLAADVSTGVWLFDLRLEGVLLGDVTRPFYALIGGGDPFSMVAVSDRSDDWILQLVAGAEISLRYSDEDSLALGVEYFFNDAGYSDAALYPFLATVGQFTPLYLGRHYAAVYALAQAPGSWNDTTLILSALGNFSDRSFLVRYDHRVNVLTFLSLNVFASYAFGQNGEFNFAFSIPPGAIPALPAGFDNPAPELTLGGAIQLNF